MQLDNHAHVLSCACVFVHLQINLLLTGEVGDQEGDVETRHWNHGFGQSGLLLKHRLLDLDDGGTDLQDKCQRRGSELH